MRPRKLTHIDRHQAHILRGCLLAALASVTATDAYSQSIIPSPPTVSTTPPAFQPFANASDADQLDSALLDVLPKGLPFSYGPVTFRPHLGYQFLYGNGISASPGNQQTTAVNEISPGILLNIGKKWVVDYTPTLRYYSNHAFKDGVDHRVILTGGTQYEDWIFGLSQGYSLTSLPLVETLSQTETEIFNTDITAGYTINSKMSLDLSVSQIFRDSQNYQGYRQWSTMDYVNYKLHPKLTFGIGPGFTYTDVDAGSDMTSEQIQARVAWIPVEKFTLDFHGGLDIRQFLSGGAEDMYSPLFGGSIDYSLFEHTRLTFSADHSISPSYFNNEVGENTLLSLRLHQRLIEHLDLTLTGGYGNSTYVAAVPGLTQTRRDNRYNFSARLGTQILKHASLSFTYTYSRNKSDVDQYSYDSHMIGAEVGYRW